MSQDERRGFELNMGNLRQINHFLGIAIDAYPHMKPLHNAAFDINRLIEVLIHKYDFLEENIYTLFNEQATRENILHTLDQLADTLNTSHNLLVYFAGHGILKKHGSNKKKEEGYWVPVEASGDRVDEFISNTELLRKLEFFDCKHLIVFSDSCFSGSLFNRFRSIEKSDTQASRWGFSSGRVQLVSDGELGEGSPFANSIVENLQLAKAPLPFTSLASAVKNELEKQLDGRQTPRFETLDSSSHKGGEFIFTPKGNCEGIQEGAIQSCKMPSIPINPTAEPKKSYLTLLVSILTITGILVSIYVAFFTKKNIAFEGVVKNKTNGIPISQAKVSLQEREVLGIQTLSDENGAFRLIIPGRWKNRISLVVKHSDYHPFKFDTVVRFYSGQEVFYVSEIGLITKNSEIDPLPTTSRPQVEELIVGDRPDLATSSSDSFVDKTIEVPTYNFIEKLTDRVTDSVGNPLEAVRVWCSNCENKNSVFTDGQGNFTLQISEHIKDRFTKHFEICFIYLNEKKCLNIHYEDLSTLTIPNF
ncbi:MAG: caspase family protein [Bacteroidota bacterium]